MSGEHGPPLSSPRKQNTESEEDFCERLAAWLIEGLNEEDFNRAFALLKRGAETRWRRLEEAPEGEIEVLAYREDVGVFTAFRTAMDRPARHELTTRAPSDVWYSTNGEYLNDDLPTHYVDLDSLGTPAG